ncbi:ECF subfamily RNA polymerase sigma-24 factor [Mycobacterium tuberculosis]|nr:ECF subfamily RNA polymerase sigma-24 factor [Mycobacterium tuberculosis]
MSMLLQEPANSLDQAAATFTDVRPRLFGIAYRMLGSPAEAEEIVQETWLRWQHTERSAIANPAAFLALITTRLSINTVQSARVRRETGFASRLHEPIDAAADPATSAERGDAIERGLLVLLERLTPAQRAAYILREAFDYPYARIAELIRLSPDNVRQLVSRSRRYLSTHRRGPVGAGAHRGLLSAFLDAAQKGNMRALEEFLAADVITSSGTANDLLPHPLLASKTVRNRPPGKHDVPPPAVRSRICPGTGGTCSGDRYGRPLKGSNSWT